MSGHKRATVTISEQEYRRLHEADIQRRFRRKKGADSQEREQQIRAMNSVFEHMQDRQNYYEGLIADLGDEVLRIEEDTSRELLAYQAAMNEEWSNQMDFVSAEHNAILESLAERFQNELQRERQNLYQSLNSYERQLQQWNIEARNKQSIANQWITHSVAISDFINNQFEPERFAPGRLGKINRKLALAQANLEQGMPEASLHAAQQAFTELSDLRVELETRAMEWQNQFEMTYSAAKELYKTVLANAQVPALDVAGNELPFPIDLDYWSRNAYRVLLNEAKQFQQYLRAHHQTLSSQELQRVRNQELPVLQDRLESMIYEARLEAIQSQLRINIADLALQALEVQGYRLQEARFANDDMRGPFVATLINDDQSSISLRILPKEGQDLASDLQIVSNDSAIRTAGELFARFQAIRSSLGQKGLTIRQVQSTSAPGQTDDGVENPLLPERPIKELYKQSANVRPN